MEDEASPSRNQTLNSSPNLDEMEAFDFFLFFDNFSCENQKINRDSELGKGGTELGEAGLGRW